jgi:hypothetical protein
VPSSLKPGFWSASLIFTRPKCSGFSMDVWVYLWSELTGGQWTWIIQSSPLYYQEGESRGRTALTLNLRKAQAARWLSEQDCCSEKRIRNIFCFQECFPCQVSCGPLLTDGCVKQATSFQLTIKIWSVQLWCTGPVTHWGYGYPLWKRKTMLGQTF